jgi:PEP-CTERM motif
MRQLFAAAGLLAAFSAQAAVLDFDYSTQAITTTSTSGIGPLNPVGSSGWFSQSYGDVAGLVDVTYGYLAPSSNTSSSSLQTWSTGYDDLSYSAWWGQQGGNDRAQVTLESVGGSAVTLTSFDLGVWSNGRGVPETVRVLEIGQSTPVFTQSFSENANLHHTFTVNLTSTSGFVIEWTSPWWVSIDNIDSTAAPVPEPGTWALMLGGLLVVGALARRR